MLTHDADFGRLAVQAGEPFTGLVYLRPGHISATFVLGILAAIEPMGDLQPPFVIVAERRGETVKLRLRP